MPEDLVDFDLEPTRRDDETVRVPEGPGGDGPRGGIGFPAILAAAAILVIALLGVLFLVFKKPAPPAPTPLPMAPATSATPAATPTPAVVLPSLDDSDALVREVAAALSSRPELTRWLAQNGLVRKLTAVVDNVANGETPRPHLEFLAPKQRFKAARRPPHQIVPDPAGFAGYDLFADTVASVDAGTAAATYRTLAPLFEAAYVELGHPQGGFPKALDRALGALLAVPVLRADVALEPHAVGFRYQDPALEALTPAQKQFLRIGPRNVRIVQGELRELKAALAPEQAPAP
jgi:Protein of unknown function (DUF3014)